MLRDKRIFILLLSVFVSGCLSIHAQKTSVSATINPARILIGEQATITLEIKTPKGKTVFLPEYNYTDTLIKGIEVLATLKPDTAIANNVTTITQRYTVTSFDSAQYTIPYIRVIDNEDTIKSNSLELKVTSPVLSDSTLAYLKKLDAKETDSIDFDALQINDIKDIQSPPFVAQDYLKEWVQSNPFLFAIILTLILLLIATLIVLILFLRKKKKGYFFKPQIILPPHVIALNALDKIKSEHLCEQGKEKEYYTELAEIVRTYIDKRYHIRALEQTSDETIEAVHNYIEDDPVLNNLQQILKLSDLVKFAKYRSTQDENDLSLMNAYFFINRTKVEMEQPDIKENETIKTAPENESQQKTTEEEDSQNKNSDEEA